jgi:predicted secreted hydrolase
MFTVAWAGMLRASEVVGLEWHDVHFTTAGDLMLYLPKTKADPGAGSWVLLAAGPDGGAQPAAAMQQLRALSGGAQAEGRCSSHAPAAAAL